MKVNIGKYSNQKVSTVYTKYMDKKYGLCDWSKPQTTFERFLEKLEDCLQWLYNNTINLYLNRDHQRIDVRIDEWDTWSMDHTLAHIILPMLKQLRHTKQGAPWVNPQDVPEELRATDEEIDAYHFAGATDPKFFERWDWILNEMIWAFTEHTKDWDETEGQFHTGHIDILTVPIDKDGNEVSEEDAEYYRMERGPDDTSHFDKEGYEAYQNRKKNGFRLFGVYYEALWD